MKIAIVGLGLIGGSYAKSLAKYTNHEIYSLSTNKESIRSAIEGGIIKKNISTDELNEMDMTIVCLPPAYTIEFLSTNASHFKKDSIVSDICGVKCPIVNAVEELYKKNHVNYISIHPMAGRECSGYKNSLADLYLGKSLIIIDDGSAEKEKLRTVYSLHKQIGFIKFVKTTKENHDQVIAYTSQMCHVVSSAFVKSPTSKMHDGFTGGSFEDLTRVAFLDADIWTELFKINRKPLLDELNYFLDSIKKYKDALESEDYVALNNLLKEGSEIKDSINKVKGIAFNQLDD